jgi:L,D-transpeptidase catalytic domain
MNDESLPLSALLIQSIDRDRSLKGEMPGLSRKPWGIIVPAIEIARRGNQVMRASKMVWVVMAFLAACSVVEPPAGPPARELVALPPPSPVPVPAERWILVQKTQRALSLFEGSQLVKTYPIVLGKDPYWAKLYQGDHRTPEGEYHVSDKYFHPFWSRFMMLDYPTSMNREVYAWSRAHALLPRRGRGEPGPGGAVGIHGTEDESLNRRGINWTEGCISLFNHDVEELYQLVPIGTRVVIER